MGVIAIDAVGIGSTGGGRSATMSLLRELLRRETGNRYVLLLDRPEPELLSLGDHIQQELVPLHNRLLCRGWGQLVWPVSLRRRRVDLVHHIKNLTALGLPGRTVVTVYDMSIVLYPEMYPASDVFYWRYVQPHMLRAADCVVAISDQTGRDLACLYDLSLESIRVIYPPCDPSFRPLPAEDVERVRRSYGIGPRVILHVGSIGRKKNLLTLLRAFEKLCTRGYDGLLVLVGREYAKAYDRAFHAYLETSPHRSRVILTGPVPDADLPALYNAAELVIFPSLYEGFGLVAVEAMACGVPLITSSAGALPEVVGDGAVVLEDARDAEVIAQQAERLMNDEGLRAQQVSRGLERAARYSATEAARQTLALYSELVQ